MKISVPSFSPLPSFKYYWLLAFIIIIGLSCAILNSKCSSNTSVVWVCRLGLDVSSCVRVWRESERESVCVCVQSHVWVSCVLGV